MGRLVMITILVVWVSCSACSQPSLIGHWNRMGKNLKENGSNGGDIEFRSDSSFLILGNSKAGDTVTRGWNVGEPMQGRWEIKRKPYLTLWLEPLEDKLFLVYQVIRLTNTELVLVTTLDKRKNPVKFRYKRY